MSVQLDVKNASRRTKHRWTSAWICLSLLLGGIITTGAVLAEPTSEPGPFETESKTVQQRLSLQDLGPIQRVALYRPPTSEDQKTDEQKIAPPTTAPAGNDEIFEFRDLVLSGKSSDRDFTAALTKLLGDAQTFKATDYGFLKNDQVGLRLYSVDSETDLLFDFDCNLLRLAGTGPGTLRNGQPISFRPGRPALVKLLKTAFPADATVQSLPSHSQRIRKELGDKLVALIESPERVECLRIGPRPRQRGATMPTTAPRETIYGYDVKDHSIAVIERIGAELATVLLDDETFPPRSPVLCFDPGFAVRFSRGGQSVTFLFCFHCRNCEAIRRDDALKPGEEPEDEVWAGSMSDAGWRRLVALAKQAFPNDAAIQSLGARTSTTTPTTRAAH